MEELDRGELLVSRVDPQHPQIGRRRRSPCAASTSPSGSARQVRRGLRCPEVVVRVQVDDLAEVRSARTRQTVRHVRRSHFGGPAGRSPCRVRRQPHRNRRCAHRTGRRPPEGIEGSPGGAGGDCAPFHGRADREHSQTTAIELHRSLNARRSQASSDSPAVRRLEPAATASAPRRDCGPCRTRRLPPGRSGGSLRVRIGWEGRRVTLRCSNTPCCCRRSELPRGQAR